MIALESVLLKAIESGAISKLKKIVECKNSAVHKKFNISASDYFKMIFNARQHILHLQKKFEFESLNYIKVGGLNLNPINNSKINILVS